MDSFELNKIAGAVLGALTVTLTLNAVAGLVFGQHEPEKPGYEVAALDDSAGGGEAGGGAAAAAPIEVRLAKADPAKGEAAAKKCGACHSFEKGGAAKAGPNLYGVVGLKHAHAEGFGYSAAMRATADKTWDFANLDQWLENPKGYIAGTSMAFAGIKNPEERANLLAYLNKNSDSPQPLPAAPAEGEKPAAGGDKGAAAPAAGGGEFKSLVAAADVKKGEQVAKKCGACHSFEKGGAAKAGPNLYGIVGLKHAHMEGFGYSAAMKATSDKVWDVDNLSAWLENPKGYIPGTSMAFAGIKSPEDRAALIAYLNKNSDSPVDLGAAGGGDAKPAGAAPAADKPAEPAPAAPAPDAAKPAEGADKPAAPAEPTPAPQEGAAPGQPGPTAPAEQPK